MGGQALMRVHTLCTGAVAVWRERDVAVQLLLVSQLYHLRVRGPSYMHAHVCVCMYVCVCVSVCLSVCVRVSVCLCAYVPANG
jgi:hypothetical protein